jgi:hypothetical protein
MRHSAAIAPASRSGSVPVGSANWPTRAFGPAANGERSLCSRVRVLGNFRIESAVFRTLSTLRVHNEDVAGVVSGIAARANCTLFLGAGISLPMPAGGPLFAEVRTACAVHAGLRVDKWHEDDPRRLLLDYVVPEVFLKTLNDAGVQLAGPLARAVTGRVGRAPNAVHRAAAEVLADGGTVWTTNWDDFIERAYCDLTGIDLEGSVPPNEPVRLAAGGYYGKLHGDARRPETLRFRSSQVIRALPDAWREAAGESAAGHTVVLAGYGGADVDLFESLQSLLSRAVVAYWLEGVGSSRWEDSSVAAHEIWRFSLSPQELDLRKLPKSGRHLLWCGTDSGGPSNPSAALLALLNADGDVSNVPGQSERYERVLKEVRAGVRLGGRSAHRILAQAVLAERIGLRWRAAGAHLAVIGIGDATARRKSARSLGNLVALRGRALRRAVGSARVGFTRGELGKVSAAVLSGTVRIPPPRLVEAALRDPERVSVDDALGLAGTVRWTGNLSQAVALARMQITRVLEQDLDTSLRDWPERLARAAFECALALSWQGLFEEADEVCRTSYLRVSGAKWTAWELGIRSSASFARGEVDLSVLQAKEAIRLLQLEGLDDFAVTLHTNLSAAYRLQHDLYSARRSLDTARRAPRQGPGTQALVLAELGELRLAEGLSVAAVRAFLSATPEN